MAPVAGLWLSLSTLFSRFRRAKPTRPHAIIFAGEAHAALLRAALPGPFVWVKTRAEFTAETAQGGAVAFVDCGLFHHIAAQGFKIPIVGIVDDDDQQALRQMVDAVEQFPWLSHVVSPKMLAAPDARTYLTALLERLPRGPHDGMLGTEGVGRVARVARASRREARLERLREFFATQGLSPRAIAAISDVAEELITNALYDAPTEAGYFQHAIPRSEDVELSLNRACEISYGIEQGIAFVRVRDTFGSLKRARLLDVLNRCKATDVKLDESRGGAGLGLWRVFTSASTIDITVVPGQLTDILVGFTTTKGRIAKRLHAIHMCFATDPRAAADELYDDERVFEQSVTLVA